MARTVLTPYPVPTPARREAVRRLSSNARALDEAAERLDPNESGSWNPVAIPEVRRAAGYLRLAATLVVNGTLTDDETATVVRGAASFVDLVRRVDRKGVIR
jgi:hypothetical protein